MNPRTWSLAAVAKQHMESLQCDLQSQPSRLRIETIDAFNSWLANQLPIAAGVGAGLRIQTDAATGYQEAARRALAHEGGDQFGACRRSRARARRSALAQAGEAHCRDACRAATVGCRCSQGACGLRARSTRRSWPAYDVHLDEDLRLLVNRVLLRANEVLGPENTGGAVVAHARRLTAPR